MSIVILGLVVSNELPQNLDGLAGRGGGDTPQRLADSASRAASERSRVQQEITELKKSLEDSQASQRTLTAELVDLRSVLEQRSSELDTMKKKMNREMPISPGIQDLGSSLGGSPQSPSSKYDLGAAQNKITGLK